MRILVVEDQQEISDFLVKALKAELFVVDVASDGERGSYLGRITEYDLIILDNILPKKSGLEVCLDIRASGKTTPILMLSVKEGIDTKVNLLNAGADDYLTKPFSLPELIARIRALLRRPIQTTHEVFSVGDLTLDTKRHVVRRGTTEIYLTRKEFMLLEYLMRNAGTVLSRAMLLEHVWDVNTDPFSNTIEAHIMSLRKKIGDTKKNRIIHTLPGRGYKIGV